MDGDLTRWLHRWFCTCNNRNARLRKFWSRPAQVKTEASSPARSSRLGAPKLDLTYWVAAGATTVVVPPVVKTLGTAPVPWMILRKP